MLLSAEKTIVKFVIFLELWIVKLSHPAKDIRSDVAEDHSIPYKTIGFAVQNAEFLVISKRPFGYKQKTFRL